MKKTIDLNKLAEIISKSGAENVELNLEAVKTNEVYEIKLKSISVTEELFETIGFEKGNFTREKETVKQPTLRELMAKGFEQVNNRLDNVEKRLDNIELDVKVLKQDVSVLKQDVALIKSLPTIQKEIKNLQEINI